ncbi:MAG: sulfite exporter TauE/SafE family protein [Cyanobacteria bacterium P01_D01_bin.105]
MPNSLDLWLILALGFLGSFGHCVGMCGPITAAFALSVEVSDAKNVVASSVGFHVWLNVGRLVSYALVGAAIGALSSVVFAGGQMAGVGSSLRRLISMTTGCLLIWFGLTQAKPGLLPMLPFLHPGQRIHESVNGLMMRVSSQGIAGKDRLDALQVVGAVQVLRPMMLGLLWGLIPCGFLYAGQLRAAETQSWLGGAVVMLAFGIGTLPAMLATGVTTALLSRDRRSQLFRIGGWLTVIIGVLLLSRTGDTMIDYSGHGALLCLVLALIARPVSFVWSGLRQYRRVLGVGAFALSLLHVLHMVSHTWKWNMQAIQFMLPSHRIGIGLGLGAIALMLPAALTSFNRAQKSLGSRWRKLHLLSAPALILVAIHTVLVGSHYWGALALSWQHHARVLWLFALVGMVFGLRSPRLWSLLSLSKYYAPPYYVSPKSFSAEPSITPSGADDSVDGTYDGANCHTD